jgi:allophanate hydrolase
MSVDRSVIFITEAPPIDVSETRPPADGPLMGRRLAVKDNVDVFGFLTTAGCPGYAYAPADSAPVVTRLVAAGSTVVGKTNLDQFATGLVGTRSPYGVVPNSRNPDYVSGGSSSGSAVAVALGLADLALGTDTAGSGRIPAAFNGIIGLKPTPGLVSTRGVVPACRSLDCVSVFARTVAEAWDALLVMAGYDEQDPYSTSSPMHPARDPAGLRVGIPRTDWLDPYVDDGTANAFRDAVSLVATVVGPLVPTDLFAFFEAGDLLYRGALVAERFAAVGAFVSRYRHDPEAKVDPVVADIIMRAEDIPAWRLSADLDELAGVRREVADVWQHLDVLIVPTAPFIPTIAEVQADPVGVNSKLGRFSTFCNPLGLAALAIPVGTLSNGMPFGITLYGPAFTDATLARLGAAITGEPIGPGLTLPPPAAESGLSIAVVGAHLTGQPLNGQLRERSARLVATTTTAPTYQLFALQTSPPKPGLVRSTSTDARAIEVEVWELAPAAFATFVAAIPPPLAIGKLELADGSLVPGFVCTPDALDGAVEITGYGGWRSYIARDTAV